jgi:hypothetical protein
MIMSMRVSLFNPIIAMHVREVLTSVTDCSMVNFGKSHRIKFGSTE